MSYNKIYNLRYHICPICTQKYILFYKCKYCEYKFCYNCYNSYINIYQFQHCPHCRNQIIESNQNISSQNNQNINSQNNQNINSQSNYNLNLNLNLNHLGIYAPKNYNFLKRLLRYLCVILFFIICYFIGYAVTNKHHLLPVFNFMFGFLILLSACTCVFYLCTMYVSCRLIESNNRSNI